MSLDREDPPQQINIRVRKPRQPVQEQQPPPDIADVEVPPSEPKEDDKVGYKSPPKASRFKPGQSGNPNGRPKGSRNWSTVMERAATRLRTITVNGKKVRMSGQEAVAEQTTIGAIKGDPRARRDFLSEMRQGRQGVAEAAPDQPEATLSPSDEALLADFYRRSAKPPDDEGGA